MMIISVLVYLPEPATACAGTLFYYFSCINVSAGLLECFDSEKASNNPPTSGRAGFATHHLPRRRELGLTASSRELEERITGVETKDDICAADDTVCF